MHLPLGELLPSDHRPSYLVLCYPDGVHPSQDQDPSPLLLNEPQIRELRTDNLKWHSRLAELTVSSIALALDVSIPYASEVRAGRNRPHPRHWLLLAELTGTVKEKS